MIFVTVLGAPEDVSGFVNAIITAGNEILVFKKTFNSATYIIGFETSSSTSNFILMETGDYLLLESGDRIILEFYTPYFILMESGDFLLLETSDKIEMEF